MIRAVADQGYILDLQVLGSMLLIIIVMVDIWGISLNPTTHTSQFVTLTIILYISSILDLVSTAVPILRLTYLVQSLHHKLVDIGILISITFGTSGSVSFRVAVTLDASIFICFMVVTLIYGFGTLITMEFLLATYLMMMEQSNKCFLAYMTQIRLAVSEFVSDHKYSCDNWYDY